MSQELAWNGVHALVRPAAVVARDPDTAPAAARAADIAVDYVTGARLAALADDWRDLARRADAANVFMHPALLVEAAAAYPEREIAALAAFANGRLAGLWGFAHSRAPQSPLPLSVLAAPPTPNAYLSAPLIDRDLLEPVCDAFLTFIAGEDDLPNIVALDAMGADTATFAALERVAAARRGALHVFNRSRRPKLASTLDGKAYLEQAMSSSSRKKLRQHRRRLGEKGALQSTVVDEAGAVCRAFEDFLALEASGWKGREGTALLGSLVGGVLSQAVGRRRLIVLAAGAAMLLMPVWGLSSTIVAFAATAFVMQFLVQCAFAVLPAHLNELSPASIRGTFSGVVYQLGNMMTAANATLQATLAVQWGGNYGAALAVTAAGGAGGNDGTAYRLAP